MSTTLVHTTGYKLNDYFKLPLTENQSHLPPSMITMCTVCVHTLHYVIVNNTSHLIFSSNANSEKQIRTLVQCMYVACKVIRIPTSILTLQED